MRDATYWKKYRSTVIKGRGPAMLVRHGKKVVRPGRAALRRRAIEQLLGWTVAGLFVLAGVALCRPAGTPAQAAPVNLIANSMGLSALADYAFMAALPVALLILVNQLYLLKRIGDRVR